jgi:hypothetical protein
MSTPCIRPEDFGDIDALPVDHPIRVHLAGCARCQSRWQAYRSFLKDGESRPRSRSEADADAALGAMIRTGFGPPETESESARRWIPGGWRSFFSSRPGRRLLILTPAAAALAVAIVMLATTHRAELPGPAFRGPESSAAVKIESAQTLPDGRIRLTWNAMAGADAYRVRVLDTALNPVFETTVEAETSAILHPSDLGAAARSGAGFVWRVTALREGEEIGVSGAGTLRIP